MESSTKDILTVLDRQARGNGAEADDALIAAAEIRKLVALLEMARRQTKEAYDKLDLVSDEDTMRDRDARAVIVASAAVGSLEGGDELTNEQIRCIVRDAFRVADAMAAERAKR